MSTRPSHDDTVRHLADEFSRLVRDRISLKQLNTMLLRNEFNPPGVCASHDFCDANEAMGAAFRLVTRRAPEPTSESDLLLWSEAWTHARRHRFQRRMELAESAAGTPVYAYSIRGMVIHDPRHSKCGRFDVDSLAEYDLTPDELAALDAANARWPVQHPTRQAEES